MPTVATSTQSTSALESLKKEYIHLTQSHQRVIDYIIWKAKTHRYVFPSLKKIAEVCKCSVSTVQRALRKFRARGWLGSLKRAYQSCLYFIDDALLAFKSKADVLHTSCTSDDHVLYNQQKEKRIDKEQADSTSLSGDLAKATAEANAAEAAKPADPNFDPESARGQSLLGQMAQHEVCVPERDYRTWVRFYGLDHLVAVLNHAKPYIDKGVKNTTRYLQTILHSGQCRPR